MGKIPTTSKKAPYGTPAMAREVKRLYGGSNLRDKKILVMGGHPEGSITFGSNSEGASLTLLGYL